MLLNTVNLKDAPEVKRVVQIADSNYKRHKAYLSSFPESGVNVNSYWDSGSKSVYSLVDLMTGRRIPLPTSTHPFFEVANRGLANVQSGAVETDSVGNIKLKALPDGVALVETGYFCGKVSTAHVYVNDGNLTKLLG